SGPLTAHDVAEIKRFVFRERAALVSGDYAPHRSGGPVADQVKHFLRNLRERAAGELRSIATSDGQGVVVEFGDRWNTTTRYDYFLRRMTNGWNIAGKVNRGPDRFEQTWPGAHAGTGQIVQPTGDFRGGHHGRGIRRSRVEPDGRQSFRQGARRRTERPHRHGKSPLQRHGR